jgi:hypothetical protein
VQAQVLACASHPYTLQRLRLKESENESVRFLGDVQEAANDFLKPHHARSIDAVVHRYRCPDRSDHRFQLRYCYPMAPRSLCVLQPCDLPTLGQHFDGGISGLAW